MSQAASGIVKPRMNDFTVTRGRAGADVSRCLQDICLMSSAREFGSAGEADCASTYDDTINIGHGRMAFAWSQVVRTEDRRRGSRRYKTGDETHPMRTACHSGVNTPRRPDVGVAAGKGFDHGGQDGGSDLIMRIRKGDS